MLEWFFLVSKLRSVEGLLKRAVLNNSQLRCNFSDRIMPFLIAIA